MPTGYTSTLYEGDPQTFEEFILSCARGMGALITMRDSAPDAVIPDAFQPSPYHAEHRDVARAEVSRLMGMSQAESQREATADREMWEAAQVAQEADRVARKGRYEAMLAKVQAWEPPTENHVGLQTFMVQQLEQSIDFDCSHYEFEAPTSDGPTWLAAAIAKARRDVAYHTEANAKEHKRAQERSEWVRDLRASIQTEDIDRGAE